MHRLFDPRTSCPDQHHGRVTTRQSRENGARASAVLHVQHVVHGAPTRAAVLARVHAGGHRMLDAANWAGGQGRGRRALGFALRYHGGVRAGVRVADAGAGGSGGRGLRGTVGGA